MVGDINYSLMGYSVSARALQKALIINLIIDPKKLLYFPWYPDAFFHSVTFNLLAPFLKNWPLKRSSGTTLALK